MNDWRKPCEHGYWDAHYFHRNEKPYGAIRCPGGSPVTAADLESLGRKTWYCTKVDAWELDIPVRCHDEGHEACHWILLIPIPVVVGK